MRYSVGGQEGTLRMWLDSPRARAVGSRRMAFWGKDWRPEGLPNPRWGGKAGWEGPDQTRPDLESS